MPQQGPQITVHYNANSPTPFVFTPASVTIGSVDDLITWVPEQNATWTFAGFGQDDATHSALPNPPFKNTTVTDILITVEDDNSDGESNTYNYAVGIRTSPTSPVIWSDPQIINRP